MKSGWGGGGLACAREAREEGGVLDERRVQRDLDFFSPFSSAHIKTTNPILLPSHFLVVIMPVKTNPVYVIACIVFFYLSRSTSMMIVKDSLVLQSRLARSSAKTAISNASSIHKSAVPGMNWVSCAALNRAQRA